MSGAARSVMTSALSSGPQRTVNQRPTMPVLSFCVDTKQCPSVAASTSLNVAEQRVVRSGRPSSRRPGPALHPLPRGHHARSSVADLLWLRRGHGRPSRCSDCRSGGRNGGARTRRPTCRRELAAAVRGRTRGGLRRGVVLIGRATAGRLSGPGCVNGAGQSWVRKIGQPISVSHSSELAVSVMPRR